MADLAGKEKVIVIGAGPVGALAALYAAKRDISVEIYELRAGKDPSQIYILYFSLFLRFSFSIYHIFRFEWS